MSVSTCRNGLGETMTVVRDERDLKRYVDFDLLKASSEVGRMRFEYDTARRMHNLLMMEFEPAATQPSPQKPDKITPKTKALQAIEAMEAKAWEAWEQQRDIRSNPATGQYFMADYTLLPFIQFCIEKRCELLGLNRAPCSVAVE